MGWLLIPLIIIVIILGIGIVRSMNTSYRFGEGMFKSSEYNLEEKDDLSDKEYYDEEGKLIKNQWIEEEGQKYYMDGNGVMVRSFPWLRPLAPFYQMFRYTRQVFTTKGALKSMLHGSGKAKKRASLLERLGIR